MKPLLIIVVVLVLAVGALGYSRGWFSVAKEGTVGVKVDSGKFKQDKEVFSKTFSKKAKSMKEQVANLWKKTEGLTGNDKADAQKELAELNKKHDRIEHQLKELEDAGEDKFDSIKQDLTKALEEVEKKSEELTRKLEKEKEKGK